MASRKSAKLFFLEAFLILPVILEARPNHHGPNFYREFHSSQVNSTHLEHVATASEKACTESLCNHENKSTMLGSNIVFPNQTKLQARSDTGNTGNYIGPVSICEEQNFCENVMNYPTDLINRALANNPNLRNYQDNLEYVNTQFLEPTEILPCSSKANVIFPKSGKKTDGNWMFIVQSTQSNFTQAIQIEICTNKDTACQFIVSKYTTKCQQNYIHRQLWAINDEGKINLDFFEVPTSCCCHAYDA